MGERGKKCNGENAAAAAATRNANTDKKRRVPLAPVKYEMVLKCSLT